MPNAIHSFLDSQNVTSSNNNYIHTNHNNVQNSFVQKLETEQEAIHHNNSSLKKRGELKTQIAQEFKARNDFFLKLITVSLKNADPFNKKAFDNFDKHLHKIGNGNNLENLKLQLQFEKMKNNEIVNHMQTLGKVLTYTDSNNLQQQSVVKSVQLKQNFDTQDLKMDLQLANGEKIYFDQIISVHNLNSAQNLQRQEYENIRANPDEHILENEHSQTINAQILDDNVVQFDISRETDAP